MSGSGIRSVPIRKFSSERCVCAPQCASDEISIAPKLSLSVRVGLEALRGGEAMLLNAGKRALGPKSVGATFSGSDPAARPRLRLRPLAVASALDWPESGLRA